MTDHVANGAATTPSDGTAGATTAKKHGFALDTVLHLSTALTKESFADDGERAQAVLALQGLVHRLETPWETILRLCMGEPALYGALKVGKDLDLFVKWHESGGKAMTGEELAKMVGSEADLLVRLLRHLAANHVLDENSNGLFQPNDFTTALVQPVFGEWIQYLYDAVIPCFYKMPEYLAKTGYKAPTDPRDGVFQYTKDWQGDLFAYYDAHPREGATFNNMMAGVMAHQAGWVDIFPCERLFATADPDGPLVVDVGGNIGQDVERFRARWPDTAARLYLQDRADVVALAKCPDPVNRMAYDFFTPQPVQGARVYYMHGVLHDWSDEPARKILENQRAAMRPGYSTLLVHDHVMPDDSRAHPHATAYDLTMMVKVAAGERSEEDWRTLLASAGLRVVQIWWSPLAAQSVIEAEAMV